MSYLLDFLVILTLTSLVVTSLAIFMLRRGWLPPLSLEKRDEVPLAQHTQVSPASKKVLIADNDPDFLEIRAELLQDEGYEVYPALNQEQAEAFLKGGSIDLAIIDVRLRDDTDAKDISGLVLCKEEAYRSIPKIILTRYPAYEYAREVLAPTPRGLPPAVAFIGKLEGGEAMLRSVEEAFEKYVRVY